MKDLEKMVSKEKGVGKSSLTPPFFSFFFFLGERGCGLGWVGKIVEKS